MNAKLASFRLSAVSVALLTVYGGATAQEIDAEALIKPDSQISVGIGNWSADRPQQGIYDAMREKGAYGLFDADIVKRDEATGTWLKLRANNVGLDNRELRGEYNRQGNFGGFLEYNRTTYDNPYSFVTPLQGIGSSTVTAGTHVGAFSRREVDLGTVRELIRLGGSKMIFPGLEFKLDFKNEAKTGTRLAGWGSAALFSVEPVDSTTRQLETLLQYTGEKLQLSGGYYGSWYDNDNPLILQRLNGVNGGSSASFNAVTPLSQALSNQAHQLFVDGGYSFTKTTRGTFKVAFTRATQDENIPSYGLTGANAPFINAPSSLDGQVNTTLVQLGLSSRPLPKLSITGNLRYYDVNDKTPVRGFVGSNTTGIATVYNTPHSYTTTTGKIEATYRLPANYSVTGGVDYSNQDRSYPKVGTVYVPFRGELEETTYRVQVKRALTDSVNGSIAYLHSERDGSGYVAANGTLPYSNQVNPLHIADRKRDKWRAAFGWDPDERLSLQLRVDHARDKYPEDGRPYGPRNGSSQVYSIDASYLFSDDWRLSGWYSYDVTEARNVNFRSATGGAANAVKDTRIEDVGHSFGTNLRGKLSARVEAGISLDWFRNTSSYAQTLALAGAGAVFPTTSGVTGSAVPETKSRLLRLKLDGKYAIDKTSEVRFDLVHERWKSNDPTWTFANGDPFAYYSGAIGCTGCTPTNGTANTVTVVDGTTVSADRRQSATFVGVRYIYKFQ